MLLYLVTEIGSYWTDWIFWCKKKNILIMPSFIIPLLKYKHLTRIFDQDTLSHSLLYVQHYKQHYLLILKMYWSSLHLYGNIYNLFLYCTSYFCVSLKCVYWYLFLLVCISLCVWVCMWKFYSVCNYLYNMFPVCQLYCIFTVCECVCERVWACVCFLLMSSQ